MILLFGEKATKSASANKNSQIKNNPVENSGILAMGFGSVRSLLTVGEYDSCEFSNPYAVDYAMYSDYEGETADGGFMSGFASAVAMISDGGFGGASCDTGSSCSSCCSSFSSVG